MVALSEVNVLVEIIHQQHLELRELFALHQEALVQGDFEEAIRRLDRFKTAHQTHAKLEEELIFPEFAKIKRQSKWDVSLYEKEHQKITSLLEQISNDLESLSKLTFSDSEKRRNIIVLLDNEKTLKGLNEHHEEREETAMLRELDERLSMQLLEKLEQKIKSVWLEVFGEVK